MDRQIGVLGLAVMGKNLALNIADHGYTVAVYNRTSEKTREMEREAGTERVTGMYSLEDFVRSLEKPRRIILMVKAGDAVDDTIRQLAPLLEKGDLLIDGGNSFYLDTMRREEELKLQGINFIGAGISGGEEGARTGPAIMPGGEQDAYALIGPVFRDISAKVGDDPCSAYIGRNGSGHFVKMVHNGIEYADMQLICEAYSLLKHLLKLSAPELHAVFSAWNQGELDSYLVEITAAIFAKTDSETGNYLVDMILDIAEQKGTGMWTSHTALDQGVAVPTISQAVFQRFLSGLKDERMIAAKTLKGPDKPVHGDSDFGEAIRRALYASKICSYAQGFALMRAASRQYTWDLDLGDIARIFRGGCIIRAGFLNKIMEAYQGQPDLSNLLVDRYFAEVTSKYQDQWRDVVATAVRAGIPVPGFSSALAYYDSYRSAELPMNLLQAQRDYFGAHTYRRIDREGVFHSQWQEQ